MPADPLSFRWDRDFIRRIDAARGTTSRSAYVRQGVLALLEADEGVDTAVLAVTSASDHNPTCRCLKCERARGNVS